MSRIEAWKEQIAAAQLPPPRAPMPTLPCDLSEYARAETGPLSWSAVSEEHRALVLDDPFDDLFLS